MLMSRSLEPMQGTDKICNILSSKKSQRSVTGRHRQCFVVLSLACFLYYMMWGYDVYRCGATVIESVLSHAVALRGTGWVTLVPGVLLALIWAQSALDSLEQHRVQIPVLPRRHLDDWGQRGRACWNERQPDAQMHLLVLKGLARLTEISGIVIRRAVEAQVLQIRDEVRDCALVYALTLTEDVQLVEGTQVQSNQRSFQHTGSLNYIWTTDKTSGLGIDLSGR